eukprot:TRINITY_DN4837_c0_g1_i4.p1 TRINITY_DN4837_c0_g1~~TRINITY_DN4837_c0_g1_i4.p1  ORF type:complete len:196 (+),score=0.93 TRINITY_DN4837_c0_g1_i4:269-856(+)
MSEEQQTSSAETDTPAEVGAKTRPSPQYLRFQLLINGQDPAEKVRQREARVNTSSESNDPLREALEWDAWVHLTAPNPIMHNDLMSIVYHNNIVKWKEFAAIAPDFKAMDSWTYPQDLTHKMTPETFERLKEQMKSTFEPALTLDPTLLPELCYNSSRDTLEDSVLSMTPWGASSTTWPSFGSLITMGWCDTKML